MYAFIERYSISANVQAASFLFYVIIISIGAIMNAYVLYRTKRLHRRDPEQFRNGIGICLCILAISDLVALLALLMHFLMLSCGVYIPELVLDFLCKTTISLSHTAYTQSMWCWFFMSALRFIATSRPLQYTTLWRLPYLMIGVSFAGSIIINSWLIVGVHSEQGKCALHFSLPTRVYWILHVLVSFVIPSVLVIYMDSSVLCCGIRTKYSDPMLQIVINRPCGEKKKLIRRFLMITISSLVFNAPENLIRFLAASGGDVTFFKQIPYWFVQISQCLYFSQFAFNAFYLTTFVYEKSLMSKTNSSRQLSMSFRQRLEENSHLIRERANTVSYRATSPMPVLVRNSSCCALDRLVPQKHWL
uniref:G-protein coupled receptors family 1 profile domain-containing protein n=1 Tax=Panagrolaimus sp. JU765 TaxID=591449 RepID=A0AC34Q5T5_9BILA